MGDFRIDIGGRNRELSAFRQEIANILQELLVIGPAVALVAVLLVPGIDLGLQVVTLGKEGAVLRCEIADDGGKALPEFFRLHTGSGSSFLGQKFHQFRGNAQAFYLNVITGFLRNHGYASFKINKSTAGTLQCQLSCCL